MPLVVRWPRCAGRPNISGQLRHDLLLHAGGGRAAVERVVVGVDQHRREVADDRRGMRGLEHLAGVGRVEERVVLPQPLGEVAERVGELLVADPQRRVAARTARTRPASPRPRPRRRSASAARPCPTSPGRILRGFCRIHHHPGRATLVRTDIRARPELMRSDGELHPDPALRRPPGDRPRPGRGDRPGQGQHPGERAVLRPAHRPVLPADLVREPRSGPGRRPAPHRGGGRAGSGRCSRCAGSRAAARCW